MNLETIENNDTLLISEILNKVVLPYTSNEVKEILEDTTNNYETLEQVIDNVFTRSLSGYRHQAWARYNETLKLCKISEDCRKIDSISLALEMMRKRYLHPSIITACRSIDELNVYLDCLEKDELDDFEIFNIKYELYPVAVKESGDIANVKLNIFDRFVEFLRNIFITTQS